MGNEAFKNMVLSKKRLHSLELASLVGAFIIFIYFLFETECFSLFKTVDLGFLIRERLASNKNPPKLPHDVKWL